ncbi:MAG: hypothetical protein ACLRWQ_11980 [Flavonifractor plautii]
MTVYLIALAHACAGHPAQPDSCPQVWTQSVVDLVNNMSDLSGRSLNSTGADHSRRQLRIWKAEGITEMAVGSYQDLVTRR